MLGQTNHVETETKDNIRLKRMFNKTLKNCFNIANHIETETKDPIKFPKKIRRTR